MDICRGVLIAMFLDYPLSKIVDVVCDNNDIGTDEYLKSIAHLMRWRMEELTLTDTRAICERLKQKLKIKKGNTFVGLLGYLTDNQYNNVLTDLNKDEPKVVYNHLFRWMEAVRCIDGDLLTIANMVNADKSHGPRTSFVWNIVHSTSENVFSDNDVLKMDLHAHLNVLGDRFYVHWIDLMNRFCLRVKKKEDVKEEGDILLDEWSVKDRQFSPIVLWKEKYADKSYMDWMGLASVIRYYLFRFLKEQKTITPQERKDIRDSLTRSDIASCLLSCCNSDASAYRITAFSKYIGKSYIDRAWDYCVQEDIVDDKAKKSPNCLFLGERWLVYNMLFKIVKGNDKNVKKIASWFYLYLLIKNKIRMEHYLSNKLVGLANYNLSVQNSHSPMSKMMNILCIKTNNTNTDCSHIELRMKEKEYDELLKEKYAENCRPILIVSKSDEPEESKSTLSKHIISLKGGKIAGVDFAGSDTVRSPDDFLDIVTYLRENGVNNLTYHIGENFYDLVDGLRAIDDLLNILDWKSPNRIAHALALTIDAKAYYEQKHYTVTMPRMVYEKNMRWIEKLFPKKKDLFVLDDGDNKEEIVIHKLDKSIVDIVKSTQIRIIKKIIERNIPIETCPTCNLRIGYFNKYSELPSCSFIEERDAIVTINTDAPGLLCTSLQNEYNLIALALKKDKNKTDAEIKSIMDEFMKNAQNAAFK